LRRALARLLGPAAGPEIAAAVCVRDQQYLLVRTSDGARWTFPKGRREAGETLAQTAAREAREEAGVAGLVADALLTEYRHAPSRRAGRTDDPVAAYVLEVQCDGLSGEPDRDVTWFDLATARERLAEGRDPFHARELQRVLEAAEQALRRR
jgi:8-oxo-dGTP pyrophosphatase MutT (NUDIX family)